MVTAKVAWPGLHVVNAKGKPLSAATFKLDWLIAAGTLLLVAGILTMLVLRVSVATALRTYGETLVQLRWAIVTVVAVLALAYVQAGLSPTLLAAANSSGGVLGKMISPQNLAIGAATVGLAGQEGDVLRKVLGWSLLFLLVMCVLVLLQSTVLSGMVMR